MLITPDIKYVGVNDHDIQLFEGLYEVPNGMAYNSYLILDDKIAILDTVDEGFKSPWMMQIKEVLGERRPDYLIVHHMEPDHSANILHLLEEYPEVILVASAKAFEMMKNFFGTDFEDQRVVIQEGDKLSLGKHELEFISAPMVHWPEVMMTYDATDKVLFSADGFGKFGTLDVDDDWREEARRYYIGIVGKFGMPVQHLLGKIQHKEIQIICPLHGPVLKENLAYYIGLYDVWSSYQPEEEGILIAYTSVYGNTKKAMHLLADKLKAEGYTNVHLRDLTCASMTQTVAEAFRFNKLVLASTTYNGELFPTMRDFIHRLKERNYSNRTVAFVENGSWAPNAIKFMKELFAKSSGITFAENTVKIWSVVNPNTEKELEALAKELCNQ
ncbi:MAG: FprA family A-type flavoprotein [Lachnospiraceae bacterium]|nr:FprA family A-type flavoprotein [Lachnospiraceae bacterium]